MEGDSYHFEFNQMVEDIDSNLFLKGVSADRYEIQFKAGYLKSCKDLKDYKVLESKSILRPVVLNQLKNSKNFRVNALCQESYFQNAMTNIQRLAKRQNVKSEYKNQIFVIWEEDKFMYDSTDKKWRGMEKDQLFQRQIDVLSNKKLFRINFSVKTEKLITLQDFIALIQKKNVSKFMRFKHIFYCRIYDYFDIQCSTIYESEYDEQMKLINSWLNQYQDISAQIAKKVQSERKEKNTKHELQLKINSQGIQFIKKCDQSKMKNLISKAFNFIRDLSDQPIVQKELTKMMEQICLQDKKQKVKGLQKDQPPVVKGGQQQQKLQFIVRRK